MKKKLSTFILAIFVATSFVGCSKEEETPAPAPALVEEVVDTTDTSDTTTETDDDKYIIEHKDGQDNNIIEIDTDEDDEDADTDEDDEDVETDGEGEDTDTDEEEADVVELEPIVDEDFSYYGHVWTQPEEQVNYKITINNTGDEAVTFNIYYGTSEFEHQVTVSSMASKTVRVENALPGEHNIEFDTEEVDLSGTIQIWVSEDAF